jgi:hypothetical protein
MPKPKIILDRYALDELRSHISLKAGFIIAGKSDCMRLADMMNQSDAGPISPSTLYRLFFKGQDHVPYKNTLDLACQFIGHASAAAFYEANLPRREFLSRSGIYVNYSGKSLLYYCIDDNSRKPLMNYFEDLEDTDEATKWSVGIALFDDLLQTKKQGDFFKSFAGNQFVRNILLERLHDPKFRLVEFETAYLNYLKATPKNDEIDSLKDLLFGQIVLFRYYYLSNRVNDAKKISKQIYVSTFPSIPFEEKLHSFVWARYKAYRIWHMQLHQLPTHELEAYTRDLILKAKKRAEKYGGLDAEIIIHTLAEAICYAGLSTTIQMYFKKTFQTVLDTYGMRLSEMSLSTCLKYLDRNGLLFTRP